MQKKIIALAIAAAFSAPAFADVSAYGVADGAVARISAEGRTSDMLAVSGGLATSRIGANASEDLGNGMKVLVNIEYGLDIDTNQQSTTNVNVAGTAKPYAVGASDSVTASNLAARQQMLAITGDFGTVATGYLQTTGKDFGGTYDPTGGSLVSPLGNMTKGGGFQIGAVASLARAPRALAYISPSMGGVTLAVNYSTDAAGSTGNLGVVDGVTTGLKTTAMLVSANYKAGPLAVGGVYSKISNGSDGYNAASEMAIGGSYDLEVAKLFATYQTQKLDNAAGSANTAMSLSATVPVTSAGTLAVSYATAKMNHNPANGADVSNADTKASGVTAAWLQGLSKTTTAYVAYSRTSQGTDMNGFSVANGLVAGGITTAGGSTSMIAAGLSKKF